MYGHLSNKIEHTCTEHLPGHWFWKRVISFVSGRVLEISFRAQSTSTLFPIPLDPYSFWFSHVIGRELTPGVIRDSDLWGLLKDSEYLMPIAVAADLRRGSAAACVLGLRAPVPPVAWLSVSCECWLLPGRGLCVGLITGPEESYRLYRSHWLWLGATIILYTYSEEVDRGQD